MNYPIRIRIGSAHAGDYETKTYTNSTFAEAVTALQGEHGEEQGYHSRTNVYVVATYAEDHAENHGPKRSYKRKAGEPVSGFEVTVNGRGGISFGSRNNDAEVAWRSTGIFTTDQAKLMIEVETLALNLALAANAEPFCSRCEAEVQLRAECEAKITKRV